MAVETVDIKIPSTTIASKGRNNGGMDFKTDKYNQSVDTDTRADDLNKENFSSAQPALPKYVVPARKPYSGVYAQKSSFTLNLGGVG